MAMVAVAGLIGYLQKLLVDEIDVISSSGVRSELNRLQDDLRLTRAFLLDLVDEEKEGEAWRQFERRMQQVVFKAEDAIDAYLVAQNSTRFWLMTFFTPKSLNLAKTLKAIREQELCPLITWENRYKHFPQEPRTQHQAAAGVAQLPLVREDKVVGFEDETNTLIGYLREESKRLDVISIVGMLGLGKTTLAWKIHCDPRIQNEFPILIWVCVSQGFNMKDVALTILSKFTPEDMSPLTDSLLVKIAWRKLDNRRFLMFIDGVHTIVDWMYIKEVLPMRNRFGKVVVTTGDTKVACEANIYRDPICLRFLSFEESWELLQLQVFGTLGKCPSNLEALGQRIARECEGLPLAIVVIGGILHENLSTSHVVDDWEKVASRLSTYLENDKGKRMEKAISLSFSELRYELKECFLYFGVFPKDTVIPSWKLIRLWIAEGFIQPEFRLSLEEVAEEFLKELVDRNLVVVERAKAEGGIKTCRLSNMMHEFCTSQAAYAERNMFQEVKESGGVIHIYPPIPQVKECRRLCIHSHVVDFLRLKPHVPRVRSFLCFSKEDILLQPEYVSIIPEAFECLRVLDVNPIKFPHFPPKIAHLIHLRYIAMSGDNFNALPEAILKLWNLQTIRIDTMLATFEIKADIWKMISLRHFKTKAAIILNKGAKGKGGENLQTLSRLSTQSLSDDICNRALNLKKLGIRGHLGTLLDTKCLAKLDRLQKLKLVHDASGLPLIRLPDREAFPPNLRILELTSTFLKWEHMGALGMLPTLEVLKLKANAFVGVSWNVANGCFPSLEILHIEHADLVLWIASGDSFPKLGCLVLKNCARLEEIPHVLVRSLQVLDIERVAKSAVESARRMEMAKQEMQGQPRATRARFKLTVAPI